MDNVDDIGCFALTELGYGNNAVEMETTAVWDQQSKEFIIHTPSTLAQACSPTPPPCPMSSPRPLLLASRILQHLDTVGNIFICSVLPWSRCCDLRMCPVGGPWQHSQITTTVVLQTAAALTWAPAYTSTAVHVQKYWITNSALHAKWSVVFAQLIMNGNNEGIHAFLVRIRDEQMQPMPNVRIEDMGHKMGCNGAHPPS